MVDVTHSTDEERAQRSAVERIVGFAKQFGEAHIDLACHAAFPLVLTPDLLYQIWAHFVPEAPWTAVARVLLSRLCRQVGYEMYEMDIPVRNLLLKELKEQFGQEQLEELGKFLLDYIAQTLTGDDEDTQDLAQAQEWTALAYTKPGDAAQEFAKALREKVMKENTAENTAEILRLASLVDTFAEPLLEAGFKPLLVYAAGMRYFVRGDWEDAAKEFSKIPQKRNRIVIAGVSLDIPQEKRYTLSPFEADYKKLRLLLSAEKWQEANEKTADIILNVAGREKEGWLRQQDMESFPCQHLRAIDILWIRYSNSHFGFSVQKRIWESSRGQSEHFNDKIFKKFGTRVGWYIGVNDDHWKIPKELSFSLAAPAGHLPFFSLFLGGFGFLKTWGSVFSRIDACQF